MAFNIVGRWDRSRVLFTAELDASFETATYGVQLGAAVELALLAGADLGGADLGGADLGGADLGGADLGGVNLRGADLMDADLTGANLADASLTDADLTDAAIVAAGNVTLGQFKNDIVPALLVAGGKSLATVLGAGCWDCHSWEYCPMHAAFDAKSISDIPVLWRAHAETFVRLFDAGLIPAPEGSEK